MGRTLVRIRFPHHLYVPGEAFPFEVKARQENLTNTLTTIVSHTVPEGMYAYLDYFWQEATDFTLAIDDNFVEYRLEKDDQGIVPYRLFVGILSPRTNPRRQRMPARIDPGQVITIKARIRPTAEGGRDGATADVEVCLAGWEIPVGKI